MQFTLSRTPFDSPVAQQLCAELHDEYVRRYGDGDGTPLENGHFDQPHGDFLVAYDEDGVPAGCGGWRAHEATDAEMKRIYVREGARRQGLAKRLVAAVEASAAAAGRGRVILESGPKQPEVIAMYRSIGYVDIAPFGYYAYEDDSLHLGKDLATEEH
ncbi:GNAT family N-acetyltransferase [Glycomyces buryatensis]|uniref:GNAT family N-acetyltransferase n=1 Tax=Glycomyces buryatensis TaxID=2570927 RepID=A0A4S8QEK3_9ACTN|nr:GNAT family N-acetyltransferase [Glycomyces buryatensis]THV41522.1 GNAT family N-acetyltransferase [Glycomyces buryatensis]